MGFGNTNAAAGGTSLNFKVVGGTTEPTNPKENMIWVNTSSKITGWYFSATQPEKLEEGELWFKTGNSSEVSFNALKDNTIQVYPSSVKQWVSGELREVVAKTYKNGAWVDWWNGELYKAGNEYENITGGWQARGWKYDSGCSGLEPKLEKSDSYMVVGTTGSGIQSGIVEIAKDFDFTKYTKITVNVSGFPNVTDNTNRNMFIVYNRNATYPTSKVASLLIKSFKNGDNVLDISNVSGSYALGFFLINPDINFSVNLVRVS
jgi:hypothetical protein